MIQPIDIVYLWCDGDDPIIRAKRLRRAQELGVSLGGNNTGVCRYRDNGELKFALRSVSRFVPWIRQVHLVMDDDQSPPSWLNLSCPRLNIVRHSQILPEETLPCFAARTIEFGIPRIPGLSERFLYSNDDMYFSCPLDRDFFFGKDNFPVCRYLRSRIDLEGSHKSAYVSSLCTNARFVRDQIIPGIEGAHLPLSFGLMPHHNVDAYCLQTLQEFEARYWEKVRQTLSFPFRDGRQLQREVWNAYALVVGKGHFRQIERPWYEWIFTGHKRESFQAHVGKGYLMKKFKRMRPCLFCFNDNENATEADWREVRLFMEKMFPLPSEFEVQKNSEGM